MKPSHQLLYVLLTLLWGSALASALPGRAQVMQMVGKAVLINAVGNSSSLAVGMVLGSGDTVSTGPGSTVDLWLGLNGDWLRVDSESTLKFDLLDIANISERRVTTSMSLTRGSVTGNVNTKLTAASKYELKTEAGVAEVRGTVYAFKSNGTLVVTKGVVNFTFVLKGVTTTVRVESGQQFTPGDAVPTPASQTLLDQVTQAAIQLSEDIGTIRVGNLTVTVTPTTENPLAVSASGK